MKDNTLPEEIIRRAIELIDKEETNDFEYEHELAIVKLALHRSSNLLIPMFVLLIAGF